MAFPAACDRLKAAMGALPLHEQSNPFVAALVELVTLQQGRTGFVTLPEFTEVLDRHFPT
ncbi:hypothetical protein DQ384_05165 [Sphaerisporangium album]|uniref:EF-hand domain-containing protein n=1 Tax=Sphaerisporangium album TaxID=509200 RepID=A0A367FQP6_9ACTN|nr:hypothetical protein [Sphaerisporangium album]RCG31935.1 hypothetical protein DQ384_05165 [Sphaerisporangium album]